MAGESQRRCPVTQIAGLRPPIGRALRSLLCGGVLLCLAAAPEAWADTVSGPLTPEEIDTLWPPVADTAVDEPAPDLAEPAPAEPSPETEPDTTGPDPALADREATARAERAAVEKDIAQLLKTAVETPRPPALDLSCEEDAVTQTLTAELVNAWVREASEPEASLLIRLTNAHRALQLLGADDATSYATEEKLAARLVTKAKAVMAAHAGTRDTVLPVVGLVRAASQLAGILGQAETSAELQAALGAWLSPLVPGMLTDLRDKHDYAMVTTVMRLLRQLNSLGLETGSADLADAMDKIRAAMRFQLTLDYQFTVTGANGNVESFHLKAEFPVQFELGGGEKTARAVLVGEGTGSYLSYSETDGQLTMQAPDFPVAARIESFDPCAGTAKLFIDRFYAESETYFAHDGTPADLNMAEVSFMVNFDRNRRQNGWEFDVDVINLRKKAVDVALNAAMNAFAGTLYVTLDHQPQ